MGEALDQLEPEFTEQIDFSFSELFSPDDPLAPWLINLARGANDLLLGNRRLLGDLDGPPSEEPTPRNHEVIYDIKAVASDAWELAKFVRDNRDLPKVKGFVAERMPEEARQALRDALAAFEPSDHDGPSEKAFKNLLASARDQASHYTEVDHKLMKRAVHNLEADTDGQPNQTSLLKGEKFKDFYAPFGTEMDWRLFHDVVDGDWGPFKKFVGQLNKVVGGLIRFAVTAIDCWFHDHQDRTRISDL
jgi:hypothetical protein